jgi:PAS domain S-box-containing protein
MEASLAFLNHVYKNAAVGLCYFDTQLRYCHINEWLAAFNGLPVEAHLGRAVHEVVPDVAAEIEAQLRHVIETGEPLIEGVVETETPAHPGVRKTFLHSFHAVKADDGTVSGVSCFVQDISEHKKAEATLRERQEQFNRALEGSNDGFWDWPDLTKDEEWWSDRWFELVGLEPGEIEPSYTNFQALLHPDDLPRMAAAVALHFEKRVPFDVEYRLQHKNGEYRWFRGRGQAAWDESGTPICMSGSIHDLSEHKKAEESMQNIQRLESLGVMAGGIAHDFNNFLTAILGNLSLAKCDPDAGSELRELIEESENACTLAKSLAQQFLTFAAGGTPILRPSSLEPLLTEASTSRKISVLRRLTGSSWCKSYTTSSSTPCRLWRKGAFSRWPPRTSRSTRRRCRLWRPGRMSKSASKVRESGFRGTNWRGYSTPTSAPRKRVVGLGSRPAFRSWRSTAGTSV